MANDHLANLPHYEAHQALKRTTASQNKMLVGGRYIFHSYLFIPWITDFEYGCNILVLFFDLYLPVTPFMLVYLPRSFIENSVWCAPDVQNGTISTLCWKYALALLNSNEFQDMSIRLYTYHFWAIDSKGFGCSQELPAKSLWVTKSIYFLVSQIWLIKMTSRRQVPPRTRAILPNCISPVGVAIQAWSPIHQ